MRIIRNGLGRIGKVARGCDLPVSTVRYYNQRGLIDEIFKTPGEKYLLNMPLKVKNTDSSSIEIEVEVIKPSLSELKEDYKQIPDINWITIDISSFIIKAGK